MIRKRLFPFLLILLPVLPFAQSPPQELQALISRGKQEIYHFQLDSALQTFKTAQREFPGYPHGYFYEAYVTTILFSQDKTNPELDSLLHVTVERSIQVGESYEDRTDGSAEAIYYLGLSHGIMGIYHVINRSYLNGYFHGKKGKNYLEKVVRVDSTYYDAYLGLGIFHYYVDLLPGVIQFFAKILGFEGDRQQGMREIRLTAERGNYFQLEARFARAIIRYFLEGERTESVRTFLELENSYPDNPALTLLLGYYHRRQGRMVQAISYFSGVPDSYTDRLPQITVIKYYNLAVCFYRMNDFPQAAKYLEILADSRLRKSQYYYAALAYYKGQLADLSGNRKLAEKYYTMIQDNKDMQYWYHISGMFRKYPMDSLLSAYVRAKNNVFTYNRPAADREVLMLARRISRPAVHMSVPYLPLLIWDLQARLEFRKGDTGQAADIYARFIDDVGDIPDDFRKSWIYLYYARVLREAGRLDAADEMLERAGATNDEYTKIIIEREKFILKNASLASKNQE